MKVGYKGKTIPIAGTYYAPYKPAPDTWQSYLSRLGNGLNGVVESGSPTTFSEEDIVANAQLYMQKKYPGKYIVEQFYDAKKMKVDLRLKFEDPKDETFWLLKWS